MKIYVKDYLRNIPIIKEMCDLIVSYSNKYVDDSLDNYNEFNNDLLTDDVTKFLNYVVPDIDDLKLKYPNEEDLETLRKNHITYLVSLFYSVKGTYKVLDYITEYDLFQTSKGETEQNQDTTTKIYYTTQGIEVNIKNLPSTLDRDLFCKYFEKFLSSLLYFEVLTISIDKMNISFKDNTSSSINHGDAYYQLQKGELKWNQQ